MEGNGREWKGMERNEKEWKGAIRNEKQNERSRKNIVSGKTRTWKKRLQDLERKLDTKLKGNRRTRKLEGNGVGHRQWKEDSKKGMELKWT